MTIDFMADIFKDFEEKELETLWKLLIKLYGFDGTEMDGFEADIRIPNTFSNEEIQLAIERFSLKRGEKFKLILFIQFSLYFLPSKYNPISYLRTPPYEITQNKKV